MISVRLNEDLENKLNNIANITKRPKSFFVKEALKEYLDDIYDVIEAKNRINDKNRELISLDEIKRMLDVQN